MVKSELIDQFVIHQYTDFGANKRQEIVRLLYEIAKREKCDYQKVANDIPSNAREFSEIKSYLVKRRFPDLNKNNRRINYSVAKLKMDPNIRVKIGKKSDVIPDHFFVEDAVADSSFAQRLKRKFPDAKITPISTYREYSQKNKYHVRDYNNRLSYYFIVKEQFDFYKACPCSPKSVYCGLHIVNLGSGCPYECTYCYLQNYINSPGIVLPANLEDFFDAFKAYKQNIRVGSGEMTDSLAFDHITEYSPQIVNFFKDYPQSTFEFKTKSNNIDLLRTVTPNNNIVVGWSVNPPCLVDAVEHYTASLGERLEAAQECVGRGYKASFHFDPIIYYDQWERDYKELVHLIFDRIDGNRIAWISLGTLRMTSRMKTIIENRFPENSILDGELVADYDGKLRYDQVVRVDIYNKMRKWIKARHHNVPMYLCMEEKSLCKQASVLPSRELLTNK